MVRTDAISMIQDYLKIFGIESEGLNENNLGGAELGTTQVYFEFIEPKGPLNCSVLLYKFNNPPQPQLLEALREEASKEDVPMGNATLDYQEDNQCLMLNRSFEEKLTPNQFAEEMEKLFAAAHFWENTALDRAADRAFQH